MSAGEAIMVSMPFIYLIVIEITDAIKEVKITKR